MADALVTHLARALHLPPDAAQQTLHHLLSTLREQIEATGEAAVPGLGVFRRADGALAFEPEPGLVRAVNHRYAGLAPVQAAPTPARRAETPAAFKPLPSFIDEADGPDQAPEAGPPDEPEMTREQADEAEPHASAGRPDEQSEASDEPAPAEPAPDEPAPDEPAPDDAPPEAALADPDHLLDSTREEAVPGDDPLGPGTAAAGEADEALAEPEPTGSDAEPDELTVPLAASPPAVDPLEARKTEEPEPPAARAAPAPPVSATPVSATPVSARPSVSRPPVERPSRKPLIAGLAVAALLAVALLLWLRSRDPAPPSVAARPPAADTVAAAAPTTDSPGEGSPGEDSPAAVLPADPTPDPVPAAPPDPLRSDAGIDRADGGFTWVVASELTEAAAERRVAAYREQGWRAGVVADEARGRTRYRVSLGQFESLAEAEARQADLPADVPPDSWILRL